MMLLTMPAHAGHWVFTTTGSGQSTLNGRLQRTLYVPSDPTTNSVSIYALAASGTYGPATGTDPPVTYTATSDLTLTVKAVWTADGNSDDTQPPSGIWFSEDTTATGTFSSNGGAVQASTKVDDGFQDPISQSGSSIGTSAKVHYVKSSGSTVTTTLTASVTSTGTTGATGGTSVGASIGPITLSIHAQPYNFRRAYFSNETPPTSVVATAGELQFHYKWSSTSGVMSDLTGETIHENVDAPSSPSYTLNGVASYAPPPPFGWVDSFHFDKVHVDAGSTIGMTDDHSWGNGQSPITDAFVKPYVANSFKLTQNYKFDDPATMQPGVEQVIPGNSGPFTITDAVVVDNTSPSGYSFVVTKDGTPSLPQPLP